MRVKETLKLLLEDEVENIRAFAIEQLGKMGATEMVEPFISLLDERQPFFLRWVAAEALGNLGDRKAVGPLLEIVERHNDSAGGYGDRDVWYHACLALARLQDERAIIPLLKGVHDDEQYEQRVALRSLAQFGEMAVIPVREALKSTTDPQMVRNCQETLERLGHKP